MTKICTFDQSWEVKVQEGLSRSDMKCHLKAERLTQPSPFQ